MSGMICPFKMMALGVRHGGHVYVDGGKAMKEMAIDLDCVGPSCFLFMRTGTNKEGQPIGGCAPAVQTAQLVYINNNLIELNRQMRREPPWYQRLWNYLASGFRTLPPTDNNIVPLSKVEARPAGANQTGGE